MAKILQQYYKEGTLMGSVATAASSGITKGSGSLISEAYEYGVGPFRRTILKTGVSLTKNIASDAAEGFGQKLYTFPEGLIVPIGGKIEVTSTCETGLSATAGEVGLGTVIATGAIATLGAGAATMEDIMEGTTIANHVAATALAIDEANLSVVFGTQGATAPGVLDGSGTAKAVHFNVASTWNQTAAENVVFAAGALFQFDWMYFGDYS